MKKATSSSAQHGQHRRLSDEQRLDISSFGEQRLKIMGKFVDLFKGDVEMGLAELLAYLLEVAINDLHPQQSRDDGGRAYSAKVLSMISNLRKNVNLKSDLLKGKLSPALLVTLSPEELATDDKRQARLKEKGLETEGRRSDWIEENRRAIQEDIGCVIEPGQEWDYSSGEESNCFEGFD